MAETLALAASIIGAVGFALQLWDDTKEFRKGGSAISTVDCAKQAASLQAHCDRVKSLQFAESSLAEADRIKAIATETQTVTEELARRLAKCRTPAGQKGWRRYRDIMTALWNDMCVDGDAQMTRLSVLRDELQSELLVSMIRKMDLSELRNSQGFQTLADDVKESTEAVLREQRGISNALRVLDVSADERHKQVLMHLRKLSPATVPVSEEEADEKRRIRARVKELSDCLWFDSISRRHYAIEAAHKTTFDWIFNGQRKTAQSSTTLMEWMTAGSGLYWISGRAGTGKSSLMRFLDDDSRTKEAFKTWAGEQPLVLTAFYFWNSEAAGDKTLKSLSGLYKGILFRLLKQNDAFAEVLFPDHSIVGRHWGNIFPSQLDLAQAFERLCMADSLPAKVGLIIDGLDEYDATSSEQMQMADMLCRAAQSPHLKIIVSSRPEASFEIVFRESTKLRLHELTEEDRRVYTSDKLKAVTQFRVIATEAEQSRLVDLVVEKSEGIFLWVKLAVMTLIQEVPLSLNISQLEHVVQDIPSGNEELSRIFDHMFRNRIPIEARALGFHMIQTLNYGYSLRQKLVRWVEGPELKHPITAMLYSFFEDDVQSALEMPVAAIENSKAAIRIDMATEMIRKYSAGLLEIRSPEEVGPEQLNSGELKLISLRDPEVHFLHKDVALYLSQPETRSFMQSSLDSVNIATETNLFKCIVMMAKLYSPAESGSPFFATLLWDMWQYTEMIMRIARSTEETNPRQTVALLDETDRVMIAHSNLLSRRLFDAANGGFLSASAADAANINTTPRRHWTEYFPFDRHHGHRGPFPTSHKPGEGICSNFLSFAIEQGLSGYVQAKVRKHGREAIEKPGLPLLSSACGTEPLWWLLTDSIRPSTVQLLLEHGADPNQSFEGLTSWQHVLTAARFFGVRSFSELKHLGQVIELMLCAGADPFASISWTTTERISKGNWKDEAHFRTTEEQIRITFVELMAEPEPDSHSANSRNADTIKRDLEKNKESIRELGQRLLTILAKQQRKKRKRIWRMRISRVIKALRGHRK